MRILLFGANGMLGAYIYTYFKNICFPLYRRDVKDLTFNTVKDIFDVYSIQSSDVIINCIGLIPQTGNKKNADYINVNSVFPYILAHVCSEYNCRLIQPTTDCIYNGSKGSYTEADVCSETGIYGVSKSNGEPMYKGTSIIRTSIIGEELTHKYSLLETAKRSKGGVMDGYTNHYWNGITCLQFCHIIKYMIDNTYYWTGGFGRSRQQSQPCASRRDYLCR